MGRMKAVQCPQPGHDWELVERDIPEPQMGQVRIKVKACGICHSDVFVKEGQWPGLQYPRVPGHEIAGRIDAVGDGIVMWKAGQRVGVGWHGGHCGQCESCRRGDFIMCRFGKICGFSYDGGWAEYVVVPAEAVALLPEGLSADEAAPLLCAGITTFNSLRHSGARAGDVVAVQGVGGLGHLALQYASKMGFITVAIGRGQDKEPLAKTLGAEHYIDAAAHDAAQELQRLGGARVILATAPDSKAIASMVDGLAVDGTLLIVAAPGEPVLVNALALIGKRTSVQGWPSGTAKDSEDTLRFSVAAGIKPMIERYPLARAQEAYQQMMTGKARFRAVLTMNS